MRRQEINIASHSMRMLTIVLLYVVIQVLICGDACAETIVPKPSQAEVARSAKKFEAVFENELKAVHSNEARMLFAEKLTKLSTETKDVTDLFFLLVKAKELYIESGNATKAFACVDLLASRFDVDKLQMKSDSLSRLSKSIDANNANELLTQSLQLLDDIFEHDRFDQLDSVHSVAVRAIRKLNNKTALSEWNRRVTLLRTVQNEFEKTIGSISANKNLGAEEKLQIGQYHCFTKGTWSRGIPFLKECADPVLSGLARLESESSHEAASSIRIAEGWLEVAEQQREKLKRNRIKLHAAQWYEHALSEMVGLERHVIEKKLDALAVDGVGEVWIGDVALFSRGAKIIGDSAKSQFLMDGIADGEIGYTDLKIQDKPQIELPTVLVLQRIRMRLYDRDNRFYRYALETSLDGKSFRPLVDRSNGEWRSWQEIVFPPRLAKYVRIRTLHNSVPGSSFQVYEFEAYCK
jgi:hypothetical protein